MKKKSRSIIFVIVVLQTIVILPVLKAEKNINKDFSLPQAISYKDNSLEIMISPQVELMAVVQTISQYSSILDFLMNSSTFSYKTDIINSFSAFKEHEVVQLFDSLSMQPRMLNFGAPANVMLYVNQNINIRDDIKPDNFIVSRIGGTELFQRFLFLLKDFAEKTSFISFFNEHKGFYSEVIKNTSLVIQDQNYIPTLEKFYGTKQKSYSIILVPLYGNVGFGPMVSTVSGEKEIYNIMGPQKITNDIPVFGDKEYIHHLVIHEFSHSYINPLTEKYWDQVKNYNGNYEKMSDHVKQVICGDWQECVNENIIRSVTTYFYYQLDEKEGNNAYNKEKQDGIIYLDALLGKIKEYENNRSEYLTLGDYYLQLLTVFQKDL